MLSQDRARHARANNVTLLGSQRGIHHMGSGSREPPCHGPARPRGVRPRPEPLVRDLTPHPRRRACTSSQTCTCAQNGAGWACGGPAWSDPGAPPRPRSMPRPQHPGGHGRTPSPSTNPPGGDEVGLHVRVLSGNLLHLLRRIQAGNGACEPMRGGTGPRRGSTPSPMPQPCAQRPHPRAHGRSPPWCSS